MTPEEHKELVARAEADDEAARKAVSVVEAAIRAAIEAAKGEIEASYKDRLDAARVARGATYSVLRNIRDQGPDHPWTGKKVVLRNEIRNRWGGNVLRVEETFGIVETFRSTTPPPANMANWRVPSIGSPIVRLLKKDGTPGGKIEQLGGKGWELVEADQ